MGYELKAQRSESKRTWVTRLFDSGYFEVVLWNRPFQKSIHTLFLSDIWKRWQTFGECPRLFRKLPWIWFGSQAKRSICWKFQSLIFQSSLQRTQGKNCGKASFLRNGRHNSLTILRIAWHKKGLIYLWRGLSYEDCSHISSEKLYHWVIWSANSQNFLHW